MKERFAFLWHFINWGDISLGISLSLRAKNIEVHLPFGFVRIGMQREAHLFNASSFNKVQERNVETIKQLEAGQL